MNGLLRVLVAGVLSLAFTGCGVELVRPVADPPAVQARPVETPLEAGVVCRALETVGDTKKTTQVLVNAVRVAGVFRGDVLATEPPHGSAAQCEALLRGTSLSKPERSEAREFFASLYTVLSGFVLAPLCLIWSDLEPDLVDVYSLEVVVRGEDVVRARYEVQVRGTISTQQLTSEYHLLVGIDPARETLAELAVQSLVSRFVDDRDAHARLRAALSDEPAAELEPLLVAKETYAPRARWRTRRLIAWTNVSLAAHVSEAKTSELRALLGRLQACMVDLAHEAEVSKDAAQTLTAKGGAEAEAVNARELSLAYRERGEALRPILTACKEELEGRGR